MEVPLDPLRRPVLAAVALGTKRPVRDAADPQLLAVDLEESARGAGALPFGKVRDGKGGGETGGAQADLAAHRTDHGSGRRAVGSILLGRAAPSSGRLG